MTQPPDDQDPAQPQPPAPPPPPSPPPLPPPPPPPAFPPPPAPSLQPGELAGPDPGWLGRKAPFVGIGAGLALFALGYALSLAGGTDDQGYWLLGLLVSGFLVTVILSIAGLTLTVIKHTRAFGAGLLISVAIGVLIGGGVCVAVLAGTT
jgi:hypothetical protein